jgi:hypothetical protein
MDSSFSSNTNCCRSDGKVRKAGVGALTPPFAPLNASAPPRRHAGRPTQVLKYLTAFSGLGASLDTHTGAVAVDGEGVCVVVAVWADAVSKTVDIRRGNVASKSVAECSSSRHTK